MNDGYVKKREAKFADFVLNARLRNLVKKIDINTFAVAVGVSVEAVRQWTGGYSRPDMEKIVAVARFFGVTTDYLLGASDNETVSYSNYADVTMIFYEFMKRGVVYCNPDNLLSSENVVFSFGQWKVTAFFSELQKMIQLYASGSITANMYSGWMMSELNKLRNIPLPLLEWEDIKREYGFDLDDLRAILAAKERDSDDGDSN